MSENKTQSRGWPMAIAIFGTLGSLVAATMLVKPPSMGDPGPGFVAPEPSVLQYVLAAGCIGSPLAAIAMLLLRPSRPWRTIGVMIVTIFGLVDLLVGVIAVVLAALMLQSVLRGKWPFFF